MADAATLTHAASGADYGGVAPGVDLAVTVLDDETVVPGVPAGLTAAAVGNGHRVVLAWTSPADSGGSAVAGYRIEVSEGSEGTEAGWTVAADTASLDTGYTVGRLKAGTAYRFRVSAANRVGPRRALGDRVRDHRREPRLRPHAAGARRHRGRGGLRRQSVLPRLPGGDGGAPGRDHQASHPQRERPLDPPGGGFRRDGGVGPARDLQYRAERPARGNLLRVAGAAHPRPRPQRSRRACPPTASRASGRSTSLDLGGNDLASLPAGVFAGLGALTSLDLGGNDLASSHGRRLHRPGGADLARSRRQRPHRPARRLLHRAGGGDLARSAAQRGRPRAGPGASWRRWGTTGSRRWRPTGAPFDLVVAHCGERRRHRRRRGREPVDCGGRGGERDGGDLPASGRRDRRGGGDVRHGAVAARGHRGYRLRPRRARWSWWRRSSGRSR